MTGAIGPVASFGRGRRSAGAISCRCEARR
jgi:hypothetical protein